MGERCYHREKWGEGPWDGEPDRFEFEHAGFPCLLLRGPLGAWCGYVGVDPSHPFYKRGYSMCIHPKHKAAPQKVEIQKARRRAVLAKSREERDSWYRLADMHKKWHTPRTKCGYRHSIESKLTVHGGVTYSAECQGEICHTPPEGEADHRWWFGFDTAHFGDLVPEMIVLDEEMRKKGYPEFGKHRREDVYRDMKYVQEETRNLAERLRGMG